MDHTKVQTLKNSIILLIILAAAFLWLLPFHSVSAAEEGMYTDGVFEGTGYGRNGEITVSVTVAEGQISSIEILSQQETDVYWQTLFTEEGSNIITDRIIEMQNPEVDAVSGATMASEGIMEAVSDALAKASVQIQGSGTAKDPYVIRDAAQLQQFAAYVDAGDENYTSAYVVLGADIDLGGIDVWNPIGAEGKASENSGCLFGGIFDGRGNVISGMSVKGEYAEEVNIGLFSTLAGEARIKDVVMKDVDIDVSETGSLANIRAGSIAGDTARLTPRGAIIDGCQVYGSVKVQSADSQCCAGGILGRAFTGSAVINSMSAAEVTAAASGSNNAAYAGGIAGMTGNHTVVANCAASGSVNAVNISGGADAYAGGLSGMMASSLYNSWSAADVSITQKSGVSKCYVGSLAGQLAASPDGASNYYASDAVITVCDDEGSTDQIEARPWSTDDMSGSASAEDAVTKEYMQSDAFAETLNSNIRETIDALNDTELAFREWITEDGSVVLSETVWVPAEVDSGIFEAGSGDEEDPYLISTSAQLKDFASSLNSKIDYTDTYIRLSSDIDLSGENWAPVGGSTYRFNGDFDGGSHTITGLSEGTDSEPLELDGENAYIGLFGWINEKAHIHDLILEDVSINTHSTGSAYIGVLAGRMSGSDTEGDYHGAVIDSCEIRGRIDHVTDRGTSFIGGITGHMFKGAIINSMTDVTMKGIEKSGQLVEVGGMAGLLNRGMIANSYALGSITGSGYRDTQYDIEGMACIGNIAAVNGGTIVNCYGQGDVEALEYSIDTGLITGWVTGIAKVYNSWYNEDAKMVIDGHVVDPVDPFGETVAGGVSDEWGFKFPGSLTSSINGYHPAQKKSVSKLVSGLNGSFGAFPVDIEEVYGLADDALKQWTMRDGQAVLGSDRLSVTYEQPEVEKNISEETETILPDGTWYGRSQDKKTVVTITTSEGEIAKTKVLKGDKSGDSYEEAVDRAVFKARFGDDSDYTAADKSKFKGKGTKADPYRIENESQLRYLAASINEDVDWYGVYFKQTKDIQLSEKTWKPIGWGIFADTDGDGFGQDVAALYPFRGIYNGGNHRIKGLTAGTEKNPVETNYMGLFGIVQGNYTGNEIPADGYRAQILNVHLSDISFYTQNRWRSYAAGLVGNAQGGFSIDNCSVAGTISAGSTDDFAFAGGLSGSLMYGSVTDSRTDTDCTSWSSKNYSYAAGMSAVTNRATIVNSYTLGDVHADADQTNRAEAGGFVGLDGGICINCYARGNVEIVSKYSMYLGGFVGMAASSSEHRQCYYNTDADQTVAGKAVAEKKYAGKFVNESAEANAQAQSAETMSSEEFAKMLEGNRTSIESVLAQVRKALDADDNGSSTYHSLYYGGNGSDLNSWVLTEGITGFGAVVPDADDTADKTSTKTKTSSATKTAKVKKVRTITVNVKTVNAKAINNAVKKAKGSKKYVTKIVLGKKVRKISRKAFAGYKNVKTLEVRTKKLKRSRVKGSLTGSKVTKVVVKVGSKKANKKYVKKYKKIFKKKIAGKKVKVTR